jgi:hypothetical protein
MTRLKSNVPAAVREAVLTWKKCTYCGDRLGPFEVDHVRPLSRGGTNDPGNLTSACVSCNTQKSNLLLHEWRQWREANGMTWPPVASHPTEEVHYRSGCRPCMSAASAVDDDNHAMELMHKARVTPYGLLTSADHRYLASYRCPTCGTHWRVGYSIARGYYSDCPCGYCVARRLEAVS